MASPTSASSTGRLSPMFVASASTCITFWRVESAQTGGRPQKSSSPNRVPTASTTSAMFLTTAEAGETGCVTSGCPSGTMPLEPAPVVTGQPRCSARARASAPAPERCVPPPQWSNGIRASTSVSAARRTSSASAGARAVERYSSLFQTGALSASPRAMSRSSGTSMCTGPGRPVTATRKAWRTMSGIRFHWFTRALHLTAGLKYACWSSTCIPPRCG